MLLLQAETSEKNFFSKSSTLNLHRRVSETSSRGRILLNTVPPCIAIDESIVCFLLIVFDLMGNFLFVGFSLRFLAAQTDISNALFFFRLLILEMQELVSPTTSFKIKLLCNSFLSLLFISCETGSFQAFHFNFFFQFNSIFLKLISFLISLSCFSVFSDSASCCKIKTSFN